MINRDNNLILCKQYVIIIVNIAYNKIGDDIYGNKKFFEKYFGLGTADKNDDGFEYRVTDEEENYNLDMVAEEGEKYRLNE